MTNRAETTFNNFAAPPWDYIEEELRARGWSKDDLATRMGYNTIEEWQIDRLSLDLIEHVRDPNARLGEVAVRKLAHAFGVSSDLFRNLEAAWLSRPDLAEYCARLAQLPENAI